MEYDTYVKVENGQRIIQRSFLLQIPSPEYRHYSEIQVPYDVKQDLEIQEALILDQKRKVVRKLKSKEMITRSNISSGSFYEDDYLKEFTLNWDEYPYFIKYSYQVKDKDFINLATWSPVFYSKLSTLKASLTVEVPKDYALNIEASPELQHSVEQSGNKTRYTWQISEPFKLSAEYFAPPSIDRAPLVRVSPQQFSYGVAGRFASWATYGSWYAQLNKGMDELPKSETEVITPMLAGISDPKEKARILYHYLQDNTRYINVSIDKGGLQSYPASYVSEKKYGDCKALTTYMKAMLKHAGVNAYPVLIYGGDKAPEFHTDWVGSQFNHVILAVPLGGDTLWLENTASYLPFNYLGTFTQNRYGLWIDGENSALVKTPALKLEQVPEQAVYHFDLDQNGTGALKILSLLGGNEFETCRAYQSQATEKQQKEWVETQIASKNTQLEKWEIRYPQRDQRQLELEMECTVRAQIKTVGPYEVLSVLPFSLPRLEKPEERKYEMRVAYPFNWEDSLIYDIPSLKEQAPQLPKDISIESEFGSFAMAFSFEQGQIRILRRFILLAGTYGLDAYPECYSFFQAVIKEQKKAAIILNPSK